MHRGATRPAPATLGTVRACRRVGPFLLSETHHERGIHIPPHAHAPASLNFVLSGEYGESSGGRLDTWPAGALQYKPAGAEHANRFDHTPARCLLIEAVPDALESCAGERVARDPRVCRDPRLAVLATRTHRWLRTRDDDAELVLEELVTELFASVALRSPGPSAAIAANPAVSRAEDLLRSQYRERWSLREIARQVGLHPAHLGRAFRRRHGCTVGEFVRALRVLHVAQGLLDSSDSIAELAHEAGFADQSHCTRVFSRSMGVPPSRYRASLE